ncbi:MAG TPA: DUF805 domain-containing protein [Burkholderiaceae bacterium]|jgi:uncharacterized membrane protein YhaH (DUF805 family)
MDQSFNQYAAPVAEVADITDEGGFGELKIFSAEGRIGRLRYLAYVTGIGFLINLITGVVMSILSPILAAISPGLLMPAALLSCLPLLSFLLMCGIQRSHDFNASGWWAIATLIPFVGLVWAFVPGTHGRNRYGAPPPPNSTGVKIFGWLVPIFMVAIIGILAAVAIPQYQHYVQKARAAQQQQSQPAQPAEQR